MSNTPKFLSLHDVAHIAGDAAVAAGGKSDAVLERVMALLESEEATPESLHRDRQREAESKGGSVEPYGALPESERIADAVFARVVQSLRPYADTAQDEVDMARATDANEAADEDDHSDLAHKPSKPRGKRK